MTKDFGAQAIAYSDMVCWPLLEETIDNNCFVSMQPKRLP